MTNLTLEALGFTKEELQQRVVDQLCEQILESKTFDEDGDEVTVPSSFSRRINKRIEDHITATVNAIADKHVLPNVTAYIEGLCLQETNKWGEKTGQKKTFVEYLVERADAYMREEVSYDGKSKSESGGYSWSKNTTRVAYLINSHLQYSINTAMTTALKTANEAIAGGIEKAVRIQLDHVINGIKTSVTVK